jgi:hypothetical protein
LLPQAPSTENMDIDSSSSSCSDAEDEGKSLSSWVTLNNNNDAAVSIDNKN